MTCIGVIKNKDKNGDIEIIIGADSCGSSGYRKIGETKLVKIIKRDNILLAMAGSLRYENIVDCYFHFPARQTDQTLLKYVGEISKSLIETVKTHDFLIDDKGVVSSDGTMILVIEGSIFIIYTNFSFLEFDDYTAIGSGSEYMLSSLYSTKEMTDSKKRLELGLEAAAMFDFYVAKPFYYETIKFKIGE